MSDRIFKDSAGTPAGYGDTVELIKDKLGNGRLGPELVTPTGDEYETIPSNFRGTDDTSFAIVDGKVRLELTVDSQSRRLEITFPVTEGRFYRIDLSVTSNNGIRPAAWVNIPTAFSEAVDGYLPVLVQATGTGTAIIRLYPRTSSAQEDGQKAGDFIDVKSLSVREVLGNHTLQTNSSLKPVLGRRPVGSEPTSDLDVYVEGEQHIEYLRFDGVDDRMSQTFPDGFEGDLIVCGTKGSWIDEGVSIPAGGELTIGPTGLPNTPNILPALGDVIGWVPVSRTTTEEERQRIIEYYKKRGAKGRLVPGPELVTNGAFDSADGWTLQNGWEISDGLLKLTGDVWSTASYSVDFTPGRIYKVSLDYSTDGPTSSSTMAYIRAGQVFGQGAAPKKTGTFDRLMLGGSGSFQIAAYSSGDTTTFDNISVRELTPEEDLV